MNRNHAKALGFLALYLAASIFIAVAGAKPSIAILIAGPIEGLNLAILFGLDEFTSRPELKYAITMAVDWLAGAIFIVSIGLKQHWETGDKILAVVFLGIFWILSITLSLFGIGIMAGALVT